MQEKIYTIPINDAFNSDCACPLCQLEKEVEEKQIDYFLSPAMMEPGTRQRINDKGFCGPHWLALYEAKKNRLSLGLVLSTQLPALASRLNKSIEKARSQSARKSFFRKNEGGPHAQLAHELEALSAASCLICAETQETMRQYARVICWLYGHESAFPDKLRQRDICLPHLALLLRAADRHLKKNEADNFVQLLLEKRLQSLNELEGDVLWFTQKFDYRNHDAPWKNSKDALPRTIASLWGEGGADDSKTVPPHASSRPVD